MALVAGTVGAGPITRSAIPLARPDGLGLRAIPSIADYVARANLGGAFSATVGDPATGTVLETGSPLRRMAPASTAKAITALYALETLGTAHRFTTRVLASGPVQNGTLHGDLVLVGSGDPTLDTDRLASLAIALREGGVTHVSGHLRIHAGALPMLYEIDHGQKPYAGYNPAIAGLNLNYNRVHFEWRRDKDGFTTTMQARAIKHRPPVHMAKMAIAPRRRPLFTWREDNGAEHWTVAREALGNGGARWLPVRNPADYTAEVFQTLLRANGIVVKRGPDMAQAPKGATQLAAVQSEPLDVVARNMLKYSTNLTAEVLGLTATKARGGDAATLANSARVMSDWTRDALGTRGPGLVDHSGLGEESRISSAEMLRILMHPRAVATLPGLMKPIAPLDPDGNRDTGARRVIVAKTGTLDFVSALSGYVTTPAGRRLAFSIMSGDLERRAAAHARGDEVPHGARAWTSRARRLQQQLIRRWALVHEG